MNAHRPVRRLVRMCAGILLVSLSIVFTFAKPASACSCVGFVDALEFRNDFAAVFVGEVLDERLGPKGQFGDQEIELTFAVETLYQGELRNRALLYSHKDNGANCGFTSGGTVAVLAYVGEDQRLRTDGCSSTPVGDDGVIQTALQTQFGVGVVPLPPDQDLASSDIGTGDERPRWVLYGGVLFLVVLGAGLGLALKDDKSPG
ncbi:MAG: hypothetical protein ACN4GZ_03120 [Acidimicrobiales bacterium]